MQGTLGGGAVDPRAELALLGVGGSRVALGNCGLEAPEMGLDGTGQATVLVVLAQRPGVALSL